MGAADAVIQAAVGSWGRVDGLANNAGICPFKFAFEMSAAESDRIQDVNLRGAFSFAQAAARRRIQRGGGCRQVIGATPGRRGRVPAGGACVIGVL